MKTIVKTAGILIIEECKILLVKHTKKASHLTGVCGFPAGRLEEGEDFIDCSIRELEEETGLIAKKEDLVPIPELFVLRY